MTTEETETLNEICKGSDNICICCYTEFNHKALFPKAYQLNSISMVGYDCSTILVEMEKKLVFNTTKEMIDYVIEEVKEFGYNIYFTKEGGYIFPMILWYERSYPELLHKFIYN